MELTRETVGAAVLGSPEALLVVRQSPHEAVLAVSIGTEFIVTREAASSVLAGLQDRTLSGAQAQAWASFVRHGAVVPMTGSVAPVVIEYESDYEDAIVEVVGRLDEIGDLIDGDVPSDDDIMALKRQLGV